MKGYFFLSALILISQPVHALTNAKEITIELSPTAKLRLGKSEFDPKKHALSTCKVLDWKPDPVCVIDGKPIFGTDWSMPTSKLDYARLEINGKPIDLDVSCLYNPWSGETRSKAGFALQETEGGWVLRGEFSDGAGYYSVRWLIINGVSVRTLITHDYETCNNDVCN